MRKNAKRGRPEFKPTPAMRRKVANAKGGGMPNEEIALALGISRNTLEKHFKEELSTGASQKRLDVLDALHRAALKGNVAAAKAFLSAGPVLEINSAEKPRAEPKVGKKEQAERDAKTAHQGTEWADLLNTGKVTPIRRAQ